MRDLIIGIDGGGTKTNYMAVDIRTGDIVSTSSSGSIHVFTMGEDTALQNLESGFRGLHLNDEDRVIAISIGDPAIDDCEDDALVTPLTTAAAYSYKSAKVFTKGDVFMAMYSFSGGEPGAFLVSGTGSMGVAMTEPYHHGGVNRCQNVGGWALPTSDPGSGYDIALQGIQAAFHAFDGVGEETELTGALLAFGKAETPRDLIPIFNDGNLTRGEIAQFAKQVAACADHGDAVSISILEAAGRILAKYAIRLMQWLPQPRIGIYGSVLLHNSIVYRIFEAEVLAVIPDAQIVRPARPPEYGAVMFAADALHIDRRQWIWK